MKIKPNRCNKHLLQISDTNIYSQYLMVTSWNTEHKPVNYLINPKANGYTVGEFLTDFEYDLDVQWVTVYDHHGLKAGHTFFVMYIEDEDGFQTFHAIPLFGDMAIRYNKLNAIRKNAYSMWDKRELSNEEKALIRGVQVVDDCFATLTSMQKPERLRLRSITFGDVIRYEGRSQMLVTQDISGSAYPFAYLPYGKYLELPKDICHYYKSGKKHVMTDFEANNILKHIMFPVISL